MQQLQGRTAVITGAASGIGLGLAEAFTREGMNLVLCDIRAEPLDAAVEHVRRLGARAIGVVTDVSDRTSVERAADEAEATFGPIHVVANNAGVALHGVPIESLSPGEWDWIVGVNLFGVIHGIGVFVPRLRRHGEEGHVINTASIAGFQVRPGWNTGAYSMTKYGVIALSEALEQDLAGSGIGVSVLCPAAVNTNLHASAASRPDRLGGPYERPANHFLQDLVKDGLSRLEVGEQVVHAIKTGEFFIFTHPEARAWIEQRHRRVMAGFDAAERWKETRAIGSVRAVSTGDGH